MASFQQEIVGKGFLPGLLVGLVLCVIFTRMGRIPAKINDEGIQIREQRRPAMGTTVSKGAFGDGRSPLCFERGWGLGDHRPRGKPLRFSCLLH